MFDKIDEEVTRIDAVNASIGGTLASHIEESGEHFSDIENRIDDLSKSSSDSLDEIERKITAHIDSSIAEVVENLNERITDEITEINDSFNAFDSSVKSYFADVENRIEDVDSSLNDAIQSLDDSVGAQIE